MGVTSALARQREGLSVLSPITVKHDWEKMTESVQNHIGSLNWGYRVALREKKVVYENAYGKFVGPHRIMVIGKLRSMLLPRLFKTASIGVSRENLFKCALGNQIRCKKYGHRDLNCLVWPLGCYASWGLLWGRGVSPTWARFPGCEGGLLSSLTV